MLIHSELQTAHVLVDGDASEWAKPLEYFDKESHLNFTISNDSKTLYLCAQAYDQQTQLKIVRGGLQLWLDTTGGKDPQVGLLFPAPNPDALAGRAAFAPLWNSQESDPILGMKRNFRLLPHKLKLTGFKPPIEGYFAQKNPFDIEAALDWDTLNDVLNYEVAIPLKTFYKEEISGRDSLREFGLTFTINGVERTRSQGIDTREAGREGGAPPTGGGGYGGGRGGMGGTGRIGGSGRKGGGARRGGDTTGGELAKSTTFWVRLRLATAK